MICSGVIIFVAQIHVIHSDYIPHFSNVYCVINISGQPDVRLRRRLSDKDKHRLVRRSSSKKNKENGSESTSEAGKGAADNAETAERGTRRDGTPVLKRTTSADSSSSNSHNQHHILARTRSEESGGQGASAPAGAPGAAGGADLIARSLPRI